MKGIILAGGTGTRLHPLTLSVSKQLLAVYDKPMIYYPLSTLLSIGIREIAIITTAKDQPLFEQLLGDGSALGCDFSYFIQEKPQGIAQAFLVAETFLKTCDKVALILGDNIFYGTGLQQTFQEAKHNQGATIFAYHVNDPERYGIVTFDSKNPNKVLQITEKPQNPASKYAIPGIYFYDHTVVKRAKSLVPSQRGELEITDINNSYLQDDALCVHKLDKGTAWLDTGTFESLMQASQFVHVIEKRQGLKIGCIEQVAYEQGFMTKEMLYARAKTLLKSGYGTYLQQLI